MSMMMANLLPLQPLVIETPLPMQTEDSVDQNS
jgi:hypothetical protein